MSVATVDLRKLRLDRGLSGHQAAREMGIEPDTLIRAERNGTMPHPRNALKIAAFYGFKVTDIWPVANTEDAAA